jgi:hypothetical protein
MHVITGMPNGCELSGAAKLLHPVFALRLRPLQRIVMPPSPVAVISHPACSVFQNEGVSPIGSSQARMH